MSKIQIIVHRPAPYGLAAVNKWNKVTVAGVDKLVKGELLYKKKTLSPGGGKRNLVEQGHWDALKNHTSIINHIKHNIISVAAEGQDVPEEFDPDALIKYQTVASAEVAIEEEKDLDRLQMWFKNDKRPEVKKLVLARLEKLAVKQSPQQTQQEE